MSSLFRSNTVNQSLDEVDISWNLTPFIHSHLGGLPLELLQSIVRYIPTRHLPAVARISSRLRELTEKSLYNRVGVDIANR